jgi:hypothetical protein
MAAVDAAASSGPRPWSIDELRVAYHWLYFRKPFPTFFPSDENRYDGLVADLKHLGGRSASAIQRLLRDTFGTPPNQDQVLAAYGALYSDVDNWINVRQDSGKL